MDLIAQTKKIIDDTLAEYKAKILSLSLEKKEIIRKFTKEVEARKIAKLKEEINGR